jgi:hypothetical protein
MEQNDATSTEETVIEQSDSTSGVTSYELATLASRICPERCFSDPKEAIAAAERLLSEAEAALWRAYQEQRENEYYEYLDKAPRIDWLQAAKQITGQKRRDRARQSFLQFIKQFWPKAWEAQLNRFKRDGLIEWWDIDPLQREFVKWRQRSKRKKGKQGRRLSEHDRRLRTQLVGLVPRKPRKRVSQIFSRQNCRKLRLVCQNLLADDKCPKAILASCHNRAESCQTRGPPATEP